MNLVSNKKMIAGFAGLFLLAALAAAAGLQIREQALGFHTRDYNYFVEQAARLADPGLANRFALNIEGYNFLGLQGIEGTFNLYHAIHLEPFRYLYVLLYMVFHSPLALHLLYSLVFFSPILYYAVLPRRPTWQAWTPVVLFALLYLAFPATFNSATASLRPRILFAAAWCMAALAVYYRRPFLEKLVLFGLLLGIREEGALLGGAIIAMNFVRMQGRPGRWRVTVVLAALDAAALAAFLAFMAWGQYTRVEAQFDPRVTLRNIFTAGLPWFVAAGGLLLAALAVTWSRKRELLNPLLFGLFYLSGMALAGTRLLGQTGSPPTGEAVREMLTSHGSALGFYMLILLLALAVDANRGRLRRGLVLATVAAAAGCAALSLAVVPPQVKAWQANIPQARLVWEFKSSHDRYQTQLLVDYDTYQAFYDYDNVIVYNRLPVWATRDDQLPVKDRFYPDNQEVVAKLIRERLEVAVVARSSLPDVLALADLAGVPASVAAENERYVVVRLR